MNGSERYVIIDTDSGVDDAVALMLAAFIHNIGLIKILAITCTHGNTVVDNVIKNVCHTLHVCDIEKIEIYKGCSKPILTEGFQDNAFGDDGLGNSTQDLPIIDFNIESEHAVNALSRISKKYPKQITLIALGPLTNLALAHLMDNEFFDNLKEIYLMGGTVTAIGNSKPTVEFNFLNDPEAAHIVLSNASIPITILPWETSLNHVITWDTYKEIIGLNTNKSVFFERIHRSLVEKTSDPNYGGSPKRGVLFGDILTIIALVYPELIIESNEFPAVMELNGSLTRGQLVVDRRQRKDSQNQKKLKFINLFNQKKLIDLIFNILK